MKGRRHVLPLLQMVSASVFTKLAFIWQKCTTYHICSVVFQSVLLYAHSWLYYQSSLRNSFAHLATWKLWHWELCHMEAMPHGSYDTVVVSSFMTTLAWTRVVMKDDTTAEEVVIAAAQPVCDDGEWTKWWYSDKTRRCSLPLLQIASASTVFYKVKWYCLHTPLLHWSLDNTNDSWP